MQKRRIVTIAEFSIHPIGTGTSVGRYVRAAVASISRVKGLRYQVTPMSTVLEASDLSRILKAVEGAHEAVRSLGAERISSTLRIDQRFDKPRRVADKVRAVSP